MSLQGTFSIVLHAHLPFVRHPEHPEFLEEDWLYEAITETYVPLARLMERLAADGVDFRLAMSVTPPLCEMLSDPLLSERYVERLTKLATLAESQAEERDGTPYESVARMYATELRDVLRLYDQMWGRDLLGVLRRQQESGRLEILTCAATHGVLPLLATDEARWAQVKVAVANYEKHFGCSPRGFWLPECAYAPGLERLLKDAGIRYFFVESHGVLNGTPRPRFGTFRPVYTPSGVAAFGRDPETSKQVWSAEEGYPGDPLYREFYRDLGYDLPYDKVRECLHKDGVRRNIGLKFHRITGRVDLHEKEPYVPAWAMERAELHAGNFLFNRKAQAQALREQLSVVPHLVAPYDAELFGHWWFEGPLFLELFLRRAAESSEELRLVNPAEYLDGESVHQQSTPALSSWGDKGYFEVWINSTNDWIYRHLHRAEERMVALATQHPDAEGLTARALNQAARELLLAQSSDWAFIMTMRTTVAYAEKRTRDHIARFTGLFHQLTEGRVDESWLSELEWKDSIFQEIDYRVFHPDRVRTRGAGAAVATAL